MGMTVQLSSPSAPPAALRDYLKRLSIAVYLCASSMVFIWRMCLTWMACMTSTSCPKLYR